MSKMIKEGEFFTPEGALVPGFTVIGRFRGKRAQEYTNDEQTILKYYFTNIDSASK